MTLRAKLVALVVGLTALLLLGVGAALSGSFAGWSAEAVDHELSERPARLAAQVELEEEDGGLKLEHEGRLGALRDPAHPARLLVGGLELAASPAPFAWPDAGRATGQPRLETVTDDAGRPWRVATAAFPAGRRGAATLTVQVAVAATTFLALEGPFRRGLLWALAAALVVGGLGAAALAHASLAPLRRLAAQVDAMGAASLDRRVDLAGLDPELRRVGEAFNGLLGRLEIAAQQQRALVARASHALRTPVATIRTRAEVALRRERAPEAYREALSDVETASAEASALIAHLLTLARLDEHRGHLDRQPVTLAPLAAEVARLLAPRAGEAGVAVEVAVALDLGLTADPAALRELLEALLDNAVHYTPAGGRAGVRASVEGGRTVLRVWDTGPGIPAGERERVFERFYRGAGAQAAGKAGSGLGLAIVRAIAEAHGAAVTLGEGAAGGLEVTVAFPPGG